MDNLFCTENSYVERDGVSLKISVQAIPAGVHRNLWLIPVPYLKGLRWQKIPNPQIPKNHSFVTCPCGET